MEKKIRIGICGYGNLGKGVDIGLKNNPDMELVAIFTRRTTPLETVSNVPVIPINEIAAWKDKIDVVILCGGSAKDLPQQGPEIAKLFSTIDSFDTHSDIPVYYKKIDEIAKENGTVSIISSGWDPGIFSINRVIDEAILPQGSTYTFWGKGVSQGHSDAIRHIKGVKNAIQYTVPIEDAITRIRSGENPTLSTREKHTRECFVAIDEGENSGRIEQEIKSMPYYFADYDTTVHFVSEEELKQNHSKMPHGGFVIRSGSTSKEHKQLIELSVSLESNPEFTSSIIIAYARACYRMTKEGQTGAKTVLDVPPYLLSSKSREDLIKELL